MLSAALLLALSALPASAQPTTACPVDPPAATVNVGPVASDTARLERLYRTGATWSLFMSTVDRRRETWDESVRLAAVPPALLARARDVSGPWRVLVITAAGCSDSANSVPYIAKLVEQVQGLEMRLVTAEAGKPWMEAHRTPDGRAATPTILLLDDAYRIRGCWVEQPAALQAWWLPALEDGTAARRFSDKMAWYRSDEGRETIREFVEVMEAAAAGRVICPGLAP